MLQNNPLLAQLKQQLNAQTPRVEGIVKGTDKGFGFIEVDSQTSYFIPPIYMKKVMPGDKIVALLRQDKEKKRDIAEPESLIEPSLSRFIGRIKLNKTAANKISVIPEHPAIKTAISAKLIPLLHQKTLQDNDWIIAEMRQHPLKDHKEFYAEITAIITHATDKFAPWWVTLKRYELECDAPEIPQSTFSDAEVDRVDLTPLEFFTIDSETTEDMDDAIYIESKQNDVLSLHVAIADPNAYIVEGSQLDNIAFQRAFTNYLPGFNIPMLPRVLSDDLCSLFPLKDRVALVCSLDIDLEGNFISEPTFINATIQSKARLTYYQVSDWLENENNTWQPTSKKIANQLKLLHQFMIRRQQWRSLNSLIFKENPDYRFNIDQQGNIIDIIKEPRRIANKMVEEAMIAANISAAGFLSKHLGYGIFNKHLGFEANHLENIHKFLASNNIDLPNESLLTLEGFCQLRRQIEKQENSHHLENRLRRYQDYAEISTTPAPHFGLGLPLYATWTSPIRKYSDLVNHRLLKAIIKNISSVPPAKKIMQHITERRRLIKLAERDITEWLYAIYLQDDLKNSVTHQAEVIDVTRGGVRVKLLDIGANAFIPISLLHKVRGEISCNPETGTVLIKNEVAYKHGATVTVAIIEIRSDSHNIIAKLV